jgi:asparagine synthase (glutamine-hydrolysing)
MLPVSRRLPHGMWGRNYLHNIALDSLARYTDSVSIFSALGRESLYSEGFQRQLHNEHGAGESVLNLMKHYAARVHTGDPLDTLLYLDSKTYLPGDILTKVDRMSMAVSLETRAPLLDHRLIDFVTRIPASLKLKDGTTKYIMKRAVQKLVPPEILNRPKQGFGMPLNEWINAQLRDRIRETLLEPRTQQRGYTNQRYVTLLLDEHGRGRRDHSTPLWLLFMLELWHRSYIDNPVSRAPHAEFALTEAIA